MVDVYENSHRAILKIPSNNSGIVSISTGDYNKNIESKNIVFPVIFTGFTANFSEKTQVTSSFGEHIHVYAFGKNAGTASLTGLIGNQNSDFLFPEFKSGFLDFYEKIRAYTAARMGYFLKISGPGNCAMKAISQGANFGLDGNSFSTIKFSLNLIITSYIGSPPTTLLGV